jgi:opacity protein-like surface antigen
MRKTGLLILVSAFLSVAASAQIPTSGNVFVGYSYYNADLSSVGRSSFNGWTGSVEGKVLPFIGIVGEVTETYGSENLQLLACAAPLCPTTNVSLHQQTFLVGPRVSVSVGKIRPFAEVMIGGAHLSANNGVGSSTSFATAIGGGLDYKIIRPVAWRLQGDYVQTRFFGTTQNDVRLSTGIVLRF